MSNCFTCHGYVDRRVEFLLREIIGNEDSPSLDLRVLRQIRQDTNLMEHLVPEYMLPNIELTYHGVERELARYRGILMSVVNFLLLYGWSDECIHRAFDLDFEELDRRPIAPETLSFIESQLMFLLPVIPEIPSG